MNTLLKKSRSTLADAERDRSPPSVGSARSPAQPLRHTDPASKSGLAWIAVRVIGLLLLSKACVTAYELILQLGVISNIFTAASVLGAQPGEQAYRLWIGVVLMVVQIVVIGFLSYYFLRKGKGVHKLLMFERNGPLRADDS